MWDGLPHESKHKRYSGQGRWRVGQQPAPPSGIEQCGCLGSRVGCDCLGCSSQKPSSVQIPVPLSAFRQGPAYQLRRGICDCRFAASCLQPAQLRSSASPTAALSTVVVPIAAGPDSYWRPQSNAHSASASSRNPHSIKASSHGTPYGPERADAALADPLEPHPDMSFLDRVLSAHTHLVRLLAAAS